ncbi:MAG: hypothetical protein V1710_00355, partial [Candidatus Bathyarchaeota archaeon]
SCGAPNDVSSLHCANCGARLPAPGFAQQPMPAAPPQQYNQPYMQYTPPVQPVSILWYLVAIIFGLIGAVVGWYVNRNKNPAAAKNILIVGVVSWAIQYFLFLA